MAFKLFKKSQAADRKVLVIGLDMVPYNLIKSLCSKGHLPNLSRLIDTGFICEMQSDLPCVPAVVWTSFLTGTNPAKHGIFGFVDRKKNSYTVFFPSASQLRSPEVWHLIKKKTTAVNIPQTYPVREINGILIAGYVALDLENSVYPPELLPALKHIDYRVDFTCNDPADKRAFFSELYFNLKKLREAFLYFIRHSTWDLFIGVFSGTERLNRHYWHALDDASCKEQRWFLDYYRRIDALIGEMTDFAGKDTETIIFSSMGCTRIHKEVYLNHWLKQQGLLVMKNDAGVSLEDIDPQRTKAFVLEPNRLHINLKHLMPEGCVEPGEPHEKLLKLLAEELFALKDEDTGENMVSSIYRKDDIFKGDFRERAPDLVLCPVAGYGFSGAMNKTELTGNSPFSGAPSHTNAFFYMKGAKHIHTRPRLVDVAPTILELLGEPQPDHLDGEAVRFNKK